VCIGQGLDVTENGVQLISEMISGILGIEVSAMLGANIADEVSRDQYCEATIG
jgi:glycerol-3-phosphate dehydrogenase (NAD+)